MLRQLTPSIFYLPPEERTDRPVLGYVRGRTRSLALDCGNSAAHAGLFFQALNKQRLPMPGIAAVTHWHWDHCYGMASFSCPTAVSQKTQEKLIEMRGWEWTEEAIAGRIARGEDISFCCDCIRLEYPGLAGISVSPGSLIFRDYLEADLGGVTARMLRLGGSHSEDSVVIHIPEESFLFLGDILYEDLHHGAKHYDPEKLNRLISDLEDIPFEICLIGHQEEPETKASVLANLREEAKKYGI